MTLFDGSAIPEAVKPEQVSVDYCESPFAREQFCSWFSRDVKSSMDELAVVCAGESVLFKITV